MTKEEFKDLIYPFSHREIAEMSGYSKKTIDSYSMGALEVSKRFTAIITRRKIIIAYKYGGMDTSGSNNNVYNRVNAGIKKGDKRALKFKDEIK